MKILFINISDIKGGAAISMWRLAKQLEKDYKTENLFVVRDKHSNDENVMEVKGNRLINILMNAIGLQYKFLPSSRKVVKIAKQWKPDVISLNNIEGGYFQTRDIIKLGKIAPVYWTMHDEWAFNNNSHTSVDDKNIYPQIGIKWGNWLKNQKYKIYQKADFKVICPCYYLMHKKTANESIIDKMGFVIYHGIDLEKYSTKKVKSYLYVAEKTAKAHKLSEMLNVWDNELEEKIELIVIGEGGFNGVYKNIIINNRGYVKEDELVFWYRRADYFLYLTEADILPLVVLEAKACGLKIEASFIGGIPEIVNNPIENFDIKNAAKEYYELFQT